MENKAIQIICHQTLTNYAKPGSYLLKETYPLPPYSTVIGMIHAICGFDTPHPMKVSVQGTNSSTVSDLYIRYSFNPNKCEKDRSYHVEVPNGDSKFGLIRGTAHVELLTDVKLVLHIVPEWEEDFERILQGLESPVVFPSLGRHDDLLNILSFKVVELSTAKEGQTSYSAYIPLDSLKKLNRFRDHTEGTVYKLYKTYKVNKKTNRREWEKPVHSKHVGEGYTFKNPCIDTDGHLVFLA